MSTEEKKVKVTYEQILFFRRNQEHYMQGHAKQFRPFLYALSKMYKKLAKHEDDYNDEQRLLNLEYCAKDKDGYAVIEKFNVESRGEKKEEERWKYTIEEQKKLNKARRDLLNREVEIEPFLTTDYPEDLDFSFWGVFSPFILPSLDDLGDEQLQELYKRSEDKPGKLKVS